MRKIRNHHVALSLPSLRLEGVLFLPDQLEKAALGQAQHQSETDYAVPKGLKLKDEYSRAFQIATAQWKTFEPQLDRKDLDAAAITSRFVTELLRDVFGYASLQPTNGVQVGDRTYPIDALAGLVPIVIAPHDLGLDEPDSRFAVEGSGSRKKSAFQLAQECLNASEAHLWALVSNGRQIRLLRDAASLTRPSFLEIDLQDLLGSQRYAEFAMAWRLLHTSRAGSEDAIWERWREAGNEEGTRVREGLREGVTQALITLGDGFLSHPANETLRQALQDGALSTDAYFQQLLRLIYRLIFLFNVEERGLLHPRDDRPEALRARQAYAEGYAFARLRDYCLKRSARNRFNDRWQTARIVFRGLAGGEPRLALPALGGLFAPSHCKDLDQSELVNSHWLTAMQALRWSKRDGSLAPVDYRNMGPEELGSVYESLLELVPEIDLPARRFGFVGLTSEGSTAGNARKLTGSYYTPDSLVQELVRSALEPVIEQRLAEQPERPIEALLDLKVIDPACGSGHFLLAAARRLAEKLAQLRTPDGAVKPKDYRHALREVIARCIYGVDRNPMAIELARTALWLEGYEEGRPLGFLDHHLQCGDALLGVVDLTTLQSGIPKDAFKALSGDDKEICKALAKINAEGLKQFQRERNHPQMALKLAESDELAALLAIEALPEETPSEIAAKESAYRQHLEQAGDSRLRHAADLLLGAFLLPKTANGGKAANGEWEKENDEEAVNGGKAVSSEWEMANGKKGSGVPPATHHSQFAIHPLVPTSKTLYLELRSDHHNPDHLHQRQAATEACVEARVFHWPLAFPQVFARGGFDCVLGNPPWEVVQMGETEFFASRDPEIAGLAGNQRKLAIAALKESNPRLWQAYIDESHRIAATNDFFRNSKRFELTAVGKLNTYPLFAETMYQITAKTGRSGFIVPTGIATDDSTKAFFGHISQSGRLASLLDIENRERLFPAVDSRMKFCLLTLGASQQAEFVFFATQSSQLDDPRRRFTLTPEEFRLINPNTLNCPVFRSERDAELTKKIYRQAPVLIEEGKSDGNPWGIVFSQGLFNMTSDSHLFREEPNTERVPLYEAKMIHQFDHRWATYENGSSRDVTKEEKADPDFEVTPRYWVDKSEVEQRLEAKNWERSWLMGWRDICRATDERTVIASVLPRVGAGDPLLLMFPNWTLGPKLACLLGDQCSLVHDFVARQKVGGTHLKYHVKKQVVNLSPSQYSQTALELIVPRVLELTYTTTSLGSWAEDLGYSGKPYVFNPERRAHLRAELDAYYAKLYGLTRDELRYILDPADIMGEDYPSETFRVLKNKEIREFGEYRTRRLVLAAWDQLEQGTLH